MPDTPEYTPPPIAERPPVGEDHLVTFPNVPPPMPVVECRPHLKRQQRQTLIVAPVDLLMRDDVRPWLQRFAASQKTAGSRAMGSTIEILPDADQEIDAALRELALAGKIGNFDGKRSMKSRGFRLARSLVEFEAIRQAQSEARYKVQSRLIGKDVPDHLRVPITVRTSDLLAPRPHDCLGGVLEHSFTLPAREFARAVYGGYDQFVFLTTDAKKSSVLRREGRGPKSWIVVFPDDDAGEDWWKKK